MRYLTGVLIRIRYLLLAASAAAWAWYPFNQSHLASRTGTNDWDLLRFGARSLVNAEPFLHAPVLHLYAEQPEIQVGPPALFIDGLLQRLFSPRGAGYAGDIAVLVLIIGLGLLCVRLLESLFGRPLPVVGAAWMGFWAWEYAGWGHVEDALLITCLLGAVLLVRRGGVFWQVGLLLGFAVACKPWAAILLPVVLALPRRQALRAVGVAFIVAVTPWLPFLVATPNTQDAFRGIWRVSSNSVLHALGVATTATTPGAFRELQLIGAFAVGLLVARRSWMAAPLAAIGVKVLLDPVFWGYYGLGPLAAALLVDAWRGSRVPWWAVGTAVAMFGVPWVLPGTPTAWAHLVWALVVLGWAFRVARAPGREIAPVATRELVRT